MVADGFGEIDESDETNNASIKRLLVEASATAARAPEEEWNRTFGGSDSDYASSVRQTVDGGYILAGATGWYGAGSADFWLVKTDSAGNEEWNQTFGGSYRDSAGSVQQTVDGGYFLAGDTCSYGAGHCDFWLVKTDSAGNEEWNRTFGGSDYDIAYSVQQTSDGGYIIAGETGSYGSGGADFWLIKLEGTTEKAMKTEVLSPSTDFSVLKDSNVPLKVKVTYEGEPTTGAIPTASFSNSDQDVKLTEGENGIYTGTWTPTNIIEGQVESPVKITIETYPGILGRVYAKVDGVIRTEKPLNIDILSPKTRFTVNKSIPQLIRIKVTDGSGNVVPGSTITKSEASFSNGDLTILLYDDGAHHDGSADDGVYANVWIPENIDSENSIDVGIEVMVYSGDIVLASKVVAGVLTPNEYVLLDTVVAYVDDISKSSVISVYYNVSKEDHEQYNLCICIAT